MLKRYHLTYIIFCICIVLSSLAFGQRKVIEPQNMQSYDNKPYHFGFMIGWNSMSFNVKPKNFAVVDTNSKGDRVNHVESIPNYKGISVGIVSNLRLGQNTDLRFVPSLLFGERYIQYRINKPPPEKSYRMGDTLESVFIDFPLSFKFKTDRAHNYRAYLLGGVKYTLDLASLAKKITGKENNQNNDVDITKLKKHDVALEVGVGSDFYFEWFKFGIELKVSRGFINVLEKENSKFGNSIDRLNSQVYMISLLFE